MLKRRAPPHFNFNAEEHNRVISFVDLLFVIKQRESKSKKKKRRSSNTKRKNMNIPYDIIGPWPSGPFLWPRMHYVGLVFCSTDLT